jgi:erythrin-vacuolar iron transport family protein
MHLHHSADPPSGETMRPEVPMTTMKTLDLAGLDLQDALDLAILIEEEARERYEELAEQMDNQHTAEAAAFFRAMVKNETRHGEELAARRRDLFGKARPRLDRSLLWEVEAPAYETVRAFMTLREALSVALEAEVKAHDFFARARTLPVAEPVKELFEELEQEEVLHQKLVREQLAGAPPDSDTSPEDYADEPVAQ